MKFRNAATICLLLIGVIQTIMAEDKTAPHDAKLLKLTKKLHDSHENHKHQVMWEIAYLETSKAMELLCSIVKDEKAPMGRRMNALAPLGPRTAKFKVIESMLFDLLNHQRLHASAAYYLATFGSKEVLDRLDALWLEDKPPVWANSAACALIPKMGDKDISSRFQSRIENKTFRFASFGKWENIPESYRKRLLSFIKKRPIDERELVYAAAKSGTVAGLADCVNYVCDNLLRLGGMSAKFDSGWTELQLMIRLLKSHPEFGASKKDAKVARRIAKATDANPVLENKKRWFVLVDNGHPGADGNFWIIVIDADSKKILKKMGADGTRTPPQIDVPEKKTPTPKRNPKIEQKKK